MGQRNSVLHLAVWYVYNYLNKQKQLMRGSSVTFTPMKVLRSMGVVSNGRQVFRLLYHVSEVLRLIVRQGIGRRSGTGKYNFTREEIDKALKLLEEVFGEVCHTRPST